MADALLIRFALVVVGCVVVAGLAGALVGKRRGRSAFMGSVLGLAVGTSVAASLILKSPPVRNAEQAVRGVNSQQGAHLAIDHVSIAVHDLPRAQSAYEALGFTIKPGRVHENTIDNRHIKFADGTALELITSVAPKDVLANEYLQILASGDGAAFVACWTRTFDRTSRAWETHGLSLRYGMSHGSRSATIAPGQSLRTIWLLDKPNPDVDTAEFTSHANTAKGVRAVWYAPFFRDGLVPFCEAMGFSPAADTIAISSDQAFVIVDLPAPAPSRPVVGVSIDVDDMGTVLAILKSRNIAFAPQTAIPLTILVPPTATHGLWLEFRQLSPE